MTRLPYLFDSRTPQCREPFGAVAAGQAVHFRVCVPRDFGCCGCDLLIVQDGAFDDRSGMFWAGMADAQNEWWECHYTPHKSGLYFYGFVLKMAGGERYVCRDAAGKSILCENCQRLWQLTVYSLEFTTPDWLDGGVMYQIFPDRFARSGAPKQNIPDDRILHSEWADTVVWAPDSRGVVRNNDFFGGDLAGIREKLPYLASLGVTCLYLNPIFESASNHRYDTADYRAIDPLLGTEADFIALCEAAHALGIRILLDGVFSHTGADSRYFNRDNRYPPVGACNTPSSPYASWYKFNRWPDDYRGWWGFRNLPEVDEVSDSFMQFINGEDGVVRHWLRLGADGWRLDVADELPDAFLDALRTAAKAEKPDALILGEVWEDASNKSSYGHRRRYLQGAQLDSVMNYPFYNAILAFMRSGNAADFAGAVLDIVENYPPQVLRLLMNHVGTHDTARLLTALAGEPENGRGRQWQAAQHLTDAQYAHGVRLLRLATMLQYCLPGVPCLYYGDEAGMQGHRDPFDRGTFPWGKEDETLTAWYRALGKLRRLPDFKGSDIVFVPVAEQTVCFMRGDTMCAVNRAPHTVCVQIPSQWPSGEVLAGDGRLEGHTLVLGALQGAVVTRKELSYETHRTV